MSAKILERLVEQLIQQGHDPRAAHAIAMTSLEKSGNLNHDGTPTPKGIRRGNMSPAQRAIDRAIRSSPAKHSPKEYRYDPHTNRATLRRSRSR